MKSRAHRRLNMRQALNISHRFTRPMASNFRISVHKNRADLHLELSGDLDGSSALELMNTLKVHRDGVNKIFVDTCRLSSIHPFGLGVLQKQISTHKAFHDLTFTGKYGEALNVHDACRS